MYTTGGKFMELTYKKAYNKVEKIVNKLFSFTKYVIQSKLKT